MTTTPTPVERAIAAFPHRTDDRPAENVVRRVLTAALDVDEIARVLAAADATPGAEIRRHIHPRYPRMAAALVAHLTSQGGAR